MRMEDALRATQTLMLDKVVSDISVLQEASQHIISAGGKRVRPRLLFLAFQLTGGGDLSRAIPVAAAVELVHTATLVHDDINDHANTRRGQPTINNHWDRTFALLTGDFLFTQVYHLMAPYGSLNLTLSQATVDLVEGETLQAWAAKENNLNRDVYQKIVAKKTASLFRAAAMLGAELNDASKEIVETLGEFGFYMGLAFQIVDDLLDLIGDPALVGKDIGIDLHQGKGVVSATVGGSNGKGNGVSGIATMVSDGDTSQDKDAFTEIKQRLIAGGAIEEGRQMADMIVAKAHKTLDKLPDHPAIEELRALITMVVERQQ